MRALLLVLLFPCMALAQDAGPQYRVAVIDTGFTFLPFDTTGFKVCKDGHYDYVTDTKTIGPDAVGHGSYVTSLINTEMGDANVCFMIYRIYGSAVPLSAMGSAIARAYRSGAKAINISMSINTHLPRLQRIVKAVTKRGVKIYTSAGNDSVNMNKYCTTAPACMKGIGRNLVVVGATDSHGDPSMYSNKGSLKVDIWEYGDLGRARGTSFASPRALGRYLKSLKLK